MIRKWPAGATAAEIAGSIEAGIHGGRAPAGMVLPTVRGLAAQLGLSPATVAAAYKLARARGLVAGAGRRGTRVAAQPPTPASRRSAGIAPGLIDLASGNPDAELLPPLDAALRAIDLSPRLYGEPPDLPALVAFAAAEFEADNIPHDHIAVLGGALDGIERVLHEHLRPGDVVALEDPGFPAVRDLLAAGGWIAAPFEVDREGPLPGPFEQAVARSRAVVITPRAQNPTGAALSTSRAADLARILKQHPGTLLVENDYAGPVAGAPAVSIRHPSVRSWAVIRSTSKFLGPDLRVALAAGDELTINRVEGRQAVGMRWVSHLLQQLVLALWSDPGSARRLARAADVYAQRRLALVGALAARGITIAAASGFNVWVPVPDESQVAQGLSAKGWAVAAGERFRFRTAPAIRVTCATLEPAAADRLAADLVSVTATAGRHHGA